MLIEKQPKNETHYIPFTFRFDKNPCSNIDRDNKTHKTLLLFT